MTGKTFFGALAAALILGCTGGEADVEPAPEEEIDAAAPAGAETTGSGSYDRASFILCPAFEAHRAELASIAGFEHDPERSLAGVGTACFVRGTDFGFVRIAIAPALVRSVAMAAAGYDAPTSPAPKVADNALFVDASRQPHVVFTMGGLIINVGVEAPETPSRETMIQLATRIRDLLVEANS